MSNDRWLSLLREAVARSSNKRAGEDIGYSSATVSLVLSGKYTGDLAKVRAAVLAAYDNVRCPHLGEQIPAPQCHATALAKPPSHNPMKLTHWRACRACPHKPEVK